MTQQSERAEPSVMSEPSATGRFGEFGGRFVPETLVPACVELEAACRDAWADSEFRAELDLLLRDYAGRPSPLTVAEVDPKLIGQGSGDHLGKTFFLLTFTASTRPADAGSPGGGGGRDGAVAVRLPGGATG